MALCSSEVAQLDVSKLSVLEESSFLPSVPITKRLNFEPSGKCRKCFNCRKHCFNLNFIDVFNKSDLWLSFVSGLSSEEELDI